MLQEMSTDCHEIEQHSKSRHWSNIFIVKKDARESCNEAIHNVVAHASFGVLKSHVTWLASHYPELTEEGANDFFPRLAERVAV